MYTNPKENRPCSNEVLFERFRRKGYRCEQIKEENATVFIIRHEKRNADGVSLLTNEVYKDLFRAN